MSVIEAMARAMEQEGQDPQAPWPELVRAALAAAEALGWKLVPVEPTQEMCKAAWESPPPYERHDSTREMYTHDYTQRYRAMLTAAPSIEEG